jgi:hypothetical protein
MDMSEGLPRVSDIVSPWEDTTFYDDFSRERGKEFLWSLINENPLQGFIRPIS